MSLYTTLQDQMRNVHVYADYFMASCPWAGERPGHSSSHDEHPSLMVHEDGFHCKACGIGGELAYLAKRVKVKGVPAPQVTRSHFSSLPQWRRWAQDYGDLIDIARHAHQSLLRYKQFGWGYLRKRKIDQFVEPGYFGFLDGWCVFPVLNEHRQVLDIVTRSTKQKQYVVSPCHSRALYVPDWQRVLEAEQVYVVYGIIDSWALYACGLPVVTGISGKSLSADQLKPLGKRYVIVPDRYEEQEAYRLAGELGWRAEVLRLRYPDGCKDPDDVRREQGTEQLEQLLTRTALAAA